MGGMLVGKRAKTFKYGLSTAADHFPNSLFKMYDAPYFHTHAATHNTHNTHARTKIHSTRTHARATRARARAQKYMPAMHIAQIWTHTHASGLR